MLWLIVLIGQQILSARLALHLVARTRLTGRNMPSPADRRSTGPIGGGGIVSQASALVAAGVRAVLAAHTQAQDAGRTDDIVALYAPDAVLEMPGAAPVEGHDAIRAAFAGWAPTRPQLHLVANTVVTSSTGHEATASSDVVFLQRGGSGWAVRVVAHYDDTLRWHDGAWLLCRRKTTYRM
jgi:ketosteroid isomerase-like protein